MILYQLTSFYNLENVGPQSILTYGLKAMPIVDWEQLFGLEAVWLMTDPDPSLAPTMKPGSS